MATFSIGEAVGSGFRLIGREPKAVLAWIGAYILVGVLPIYGLIATLVPDMLAMMQAAGSQDIEDVWAFQRKIFVLYPFLALLGLIAATLLLGAIYRAVLQPEDRRFLYLRLGRQELWLGIAFLVFVVLMAVASVAIMIPITVAGALAIRGADAGELAAVPGMFGLLFLCWLAILAVTLRFSLGVPMSFHQARFALFDSWDRTRGQFLRLFLTGLAITGVMILLYIAYAIVMSIVVGAVVGGAIFGAGGFQGSPDEMMRALGPAALVWGVLGSVGNVLMYVILAAPFADIYRQLTASDETRATV